MTKDEKLIYLIKYLIAEDGRYKDISIPGDGGARFNLFRSLVNIRPPKKADEEFLAVQDSFLREMTAEKGITDIADLTPAEGNMYLWKGDITTIRCGAIVNAANSQLLGCFRPCHSCIDNAIHTFAGVQLRLECAEMMEKQGFPEPTGQAKLTSAYDLPCGYVIHTVGPVVRGRLTDTHIRQLADCYKSCLELAAENGIDSIAFCCISTGVFGFPQREAAETAIEAVRRYSGEIKVIFNVFKESDYEIYGKLLGKV